MPTTEYSTESYQLDIGPLGYIEGQTVTSKGQPALHYFGGLPYALPPVGPYRFRKARQLPPCYRYGTRVSPGHFSEGTAHCPQPSWLKPQDESTWDENCLQLNIYIPAGKAPKEGWPVMFYIHGGFLQFGDPNMSAKGLTPLLSETPFRCIVVAPAYRVNAFGFIASKELQDEAAKNGETTGNMGFWDQRAALFWTWKNIALFGGNHANITVSGYSAGSHSAFQQLAHELYFVSDEKAIIKRVIMWSNSPGVQAKTVAEHQGQFDEYLKVLGIPSHLSGEDKLRRLRSIPAKQLVKAQDHLKISEFRALSDGVFIPKDLIANINSGDFAKRMQRRGIKIMNGENRDEHNLYRNWRTPSNSYSAVHTRLCADYPKSTSTKLMHYYCHGKQDLPPKYSDWQHLFGHIYADMQVHCLERGFLNSLIRGGLVPGKDLLRYRFEKRMKCADEILPPEWEVTHHTDIVIWFWGMGVGDGLTKSEKKEVQGWNEQFAAFVKGDDVKWGTSTAKGVRRLKSDGSTDVWEDEMWDKGLELWDLVDGEDTKSISKL